MNYTLALIDKVIVITGASSGAGRAAAVEFAQYNTKLVLAARNEEALQEAAAECRELGAEVLVVPTDVTDSKAMIELANIANDWQGRLNVWINNAGVMAAGAFDDMPMETHEQVIQTNLIGYMNGVHAVLPIFKSQKSGTIINNISVGGFLPVPYGTGYTASKFGLRGFSEALKAELGEWPDIHICDLFPAFLDTPGMIHAGNYTGKSIKPASPIYDPRVVAQAMVEVAASPKSNKYVGVVSPLFKIGHALFPELTTKATGWIMRRYFKKAGDMSPTDGNLYDTVDYGMATNGGFSFLAKSGGYGKYIAAAVVAGIAAGIWAVKR